MIRISISYFYKLGGVLSRLESVAGDKTLLDVWPQVHDAKNEVEALFGTDWFFPAVKSAFAPGQKLIQALTPLTARTDFETKLTPLETYNIQTARNEFETVLKNELAVTDSYFVTRKAGYDTTSLIGNAERCFPPSLVTKVPQALADVREAGKCLAFELGTAAGFHALRGTEEVLRSYWTAVSGGKKHPRPRTLGAYLKLMDKQDFGSKKARAALRQIKDLHRNPLMHPQDTLTPEDAVELFGICQSAISAMLKDIPVPSAAVSSSTASFGNL